MLSLWLRFYSQQLLSLREVILEKDTRFEECIQKHEEELVQLALGSEVNKDLQQVSVVVIAIN